ncbi:MAG: hypothetical protein II839_11450 [Kiritimatiellae bacterium]|nr:hypothetical protein [Kiritimatiellia bacterium]
MNKTILRSLLLALMGACATDLRAAPAWTTTDVEPASWTALSGNLIAGLTGTKTGTISTGYGTDSMAVLTDGVVPTVNGNESRVAFQNTGAVEWSFTTPKTLEQVRVSGCYLGGSTYTRISISAVYVKLFGADTWTALDGSSFLDNSGRSQNVVLCASLADPGTGYLAQGVSGLKVAFGADVPLASYIVEIEAAGSSEATGPVLGSFGIAPAKTKATVSGSIADAGTDATACNVYLALDGGAATKIAAGVAGSFEYQLKGLTAGTEYDYELSVSNNAATAKGTVRTGTFTTLAANAQTALWTQEDVAPGDWLALTNNILAGKRGTLTSGAIAGTNYATDDSSVLTDASVPTAGGAAYIYGFQNNATMEWTLDKAMTLERLRISACYLAGSTYTKLAVSSVSVKLAGSDTWTALDAPAFSDIAGRSQNVILLATLSDCETGVLSENVAGLRIVFGNVNALASYCAEIEAVGHAEGKKGAVVIFVQ